MKRAVTLLVLMLGLLFSARAEAHARSVSYSTIRLDGTRANVRLRVSELDANLLESTGIPRKDLAAHSARTLSLTSGDGPCVLEPGSLHELEPSGGFVEIEWQLGCPSASGLVLASRLLFAENASHLHFARVLTPELSEGSEVVLDSGHPSAALPSARAGKRESAGFVGFVEMGVLHILSGWDHLVFVFVLVLAGTTLRRTALVVTGFTLGHSVTLGLATLGAVVPHAGPVEAAIGLSIALLALENAWMAQGWRSTILPASGVVGLALAASVAILLGRASALALVGLTLFAGCYFASLARASRPDVARVAVAALFGLVHGLGFARVLSEMYLPRTHLVRALVGFNVGVELGQVAFVALAWPLVCALRTQPDTRRRALLSLGSALALGLGTYWFVVRAFS